MKDSRALEKQNTGRNMGNALYVLGAGILWGMIAVFIDLLKEAGFTSMQCVAIRAFFTALILVCILLICDRPALAIRLSDLRYFLGTGILSIVFFNYSYFQAIELVGGAAVPALLMYTAPIFVMILSFFLFREPMTGKKVFAIVLTFVGLALVTGAFSEGERISAAALLFGLGSGVGYALYSIFSKMVIHRYSAITITTYTFLVAAAAAIPVSGVWGRLELLATPTGLGAALGLAVFSTILPFLLYTKGLKGMEAGKASILATAEPVVAAVVGRILYQERFTASKAAGMLLVLLAIISLNVEIPSAAAGRLKRKKS